MRDRPQLEAERRSVDRLPLAAALAAAQLALVGPLAVWVDNRESFAGFSPQATLTLGLAALVLAALFAAPGLLLPRLEPRASAFLCALTLLMWGQSFLSGRLLTGTNLAGAASTAQVVAEPLIWVAVLVAAGWLAARVGRPLLRFAALALLVQSLALGWTAWRLDPGSRALGVDRPEDLAGLATLSANRNILVLVLDGMHRDYATRALEANPELAERFAGFEVFTDHLASFPTTRFSLPSMLSGLAYDNTVPATQFIERSLTGRDSLPRWLQEAGWDVGLATTIRTALAAPADHQLAVDAYVRRQRTARALGLELLDLSLFRHAPSRIGRWVYNDDRWRLQQLAPAARTNYHAVRSQDFMTDFVPLLRAAGERPAFRFIHIGGAHPPVVVDGDCSFLGVQPISPESYGPQVECALSQAADLIERLDALGILRRTAVIIASDHGVDVKAESTDQADPFAWVLDHAAASLMVKPFDATGGPTFERAPTSNLDLPGIVRRLSEPATAGDYLPSGITPSRERAFHFHLWQNNDWRKSHLTALHHFRVTPGAGAKSSWTYTGTTASPELPADEQQRIERDAARYFPSGN